MFKYLYSCINRLPRPHGGASLRTEYADGVTIDARHRLRVSQPNDIHESKFIYNEHDRQIWEPILVGGGTISHSANDSTVELAVGTADADSAIHQTHQYYSYVSGRSFQIECSQTFAAGKANLIQRVGYFDDNNGIFMELNGTTLNLVLRSSTSGSVVDTKYPQSLWNLDRLDGSKIEMTNPSLTTLDITKAQSLLIDFHYSGIGRIRFGFDIGHDNIYVHEIINANVIETAFMATPNLPLRLEIVNNGATDSASTMRQIGSNIVSEGANAQPGIAFGVSNGIVTRSISVRTPIIVLRPLATFDGHVNRIVARLQDLEIITDADCYVEVIHFHDPTSFTNGTWNPVDVKNSSVEFSVNTTAIVGGDAHLIKPGYATAAAANKNNLTLIYIGELASHYDIHRNADNTNASAIAIYMTPFTGTAEVSVAAQFKELY